MTTPPDQPWDAEADEIAEDERRARAGRAAQGEHETRRRRVLVAAAVAAGLAALALVTWFGLSATDRVITTQVVTYSAEDRELTVTYEVTRPVGTEVECTVEAVDATYGSVGVLDVTVPAAQERTTRTTAQVRTTTRAVNVDVSDCRETP